jgi:methionyl-tRNA synthetase
MTIGQDCDFSPERFSARYTSDLANDLGNLVGRLLNMCHRYCGGTMESFGEFGEPENKMKKLWDTSVPEIISLCNEFAFHSALEKLFSCVSAVNSYVEERSPWKLAKSSDEADKRLIATTIAVASECVRIAAVLLAPVMPTSSRKILSALGYEGEINWGSVVRFDNLLAGNKLAEGLILFPRVD